MDKKYFLNYIIFFGLIAILALGFRWFKAREPESQEPTTEEQEQWSIEALDEQGNPVQIEVEPILEGEPQAVEPEPNGLKVETLQEGSGQAAKNGDRLSVHYTGVLINGTQFDSSLVRGQPFEFTLGADQVIQGWDQGLLGMKVGEKRKLTIPPELGYGSAGAGSKIPPNATLIFEVELLAIK